MFGRPHPTPPKISTPNSNQLFRTPNSIKSEDNDNDIPANLKNFVIENLALCDTTIKDITMYDFNEKKRSSDDNNDGKRSKTKN